jgi:2-phosphoglycerate kinase
MIGGNSGAGKTMLAREIGLFFGLPWEQVDSLRLMLEWNTDPIQRPALHLFDDIVAIVRHPAEVVTSWRIANAVETSHSIEVVVAHHVSSGAPVILEGDDIVPAMATQRTFAKFDVPERAVQSVFVIESDEAIILANMRKRGAGFGFSRHTSAEQANRVRVSRLYGEWLEQEADRYGLPTLRARPYDTLAQRIIALFG